MFEPAVPAPLVRILLIEDSKGDAILIDKALSQAMPDAYQLQRASTLGAALKNLAESQYDVILLDRSLPDTFEFSGLISLQNMAPKLPIIFLTALKDESVALGAVDRGAQDYLFKDKADGQTIKRSIQYAIHRKRFEEVLTTRANYDPLTGLANRSLFEDRVDITLARMKRTPSGIGIFFLDLNGFKKINDTMGHAAGDQLLQEVALRLKKSVRAFDTAARFGGDEFALLIDGDGSGITCEMIARKIIAAVSDAPFTIGQKQINMGVSIGISVCSTDEPMTKKQLLHCADQAMYRAKKNSESNYQFYTDSASEDDKSHASA